MFQNNFEILKTMREGRNIELEVTLDKDMISQIAQNIKNSIEDSVVQPSYYVEKDKTDKILVDGTSVSKIKLVNDKKKHDVVIYRK